MYNGIEHLQDTSMLFVNTSPHEPAGFNLLGGEGGEASPPKAFPIAI